MPKEIYLKLTLPALAPLTKTQKTIRIFGLVLVLFSLFLLRPNQTNLSFAENEKLPHQVQTKNPVRIDIEKTNTHLPIEETKIENGVWEINPNGASHLNISADPGIEGNIIIYDHNTLNNFGGIVQLKSGDIIELTTQDKKIFRYKVYQAIVVHPSDISTLTEGSSQTLTLYTCYGFLDSKRIVIKAKRV